VDKAVHDAVQGKEIQGGDGIVFPTFEEPVISLVIVAWRSLSHLRECLVTIKRNPPDVPYEIIVALNESSPDLLSELQRRLDGVKVLDSAVNLGFGTACNWAAAGARGTSLMLLNDDVMIQDGSLQALVDALDSHPEVGAVGSRVLDLGGQLQEAGSVLWSDGSVSQVSHAVDPDGAIASQQRRCDYCSAASLLVRRSAWDEVGGFDEGYFPAYYEDVDFCLKLRARGFAILYEPRSVVMHESGASASERYRHFLAARNRDRLVHRWPSFLSRQEPPPDPMTPAAVLRAVQATKDAPIASPPESLPEDVRLDLGQPVEFVQRELLLTRAFARELEDLINRDDESRQRDLEHLTRAVVTRDAYLEKAYLQIEELATALAESSDQLQAARLPAAPQPG